MLLTNGQSLLHLGNSYMIATLKHLIWAGSRNSTTDEKLTHIFQALDCLCETFGFATQNLIQNLNIPQQNAIKKVLKSARNEIIDISDTIADMKQSQVARVIAERTSSNPPATTRDFGLCLRDLLMLFDLVDADLMETNSWTSIRGKRWLNYISHCRGVEIHKGYLDFYKGEFDPIEEGKIRAHLHDILLRLVFRMLNYNGIYRSTIAPLPNPKKIDWVKSNTNLKELGY